MSRYDIRIAVLTAVVWTVAVSVRFAHGAEPVPSPPFTLEQISNPPPRTLDFEHKPEPFRMKLFRADPKLLEQKFIAIIRCPRRPQARTLSLYSHPRHADVQSILFFDGYSPFDQQHLDSDVSPSEFLSLAMQKFPEQKQPEPLIRELIESKAADRRFITGDPITERLAGASQMAGFEFRILAPDQKRAEIYAAGLLQILDWGVSRPIQLSLMKERELAIDALSKIQGELNEHDRQINHTKTRLEETKDIQTEGLTDLRTQQWLLQVDIAGSKAKVEACDKLMSNRDLSPMRRDQVLDLKITAEIELAGLAAKKIVLDELVSAMRKRKESEQNLLLATRKREASNEQFKSMTGQLERIDNTILRFAPLPLENNRIVIQPIQWAES